MSALFWRRVWPYLVCVAVCVAVIAGVRQAWRGQWERGRASALQEAALVATAQRDTVRIAVAHTDTVFKTYTRQVGRVQKTAERVHDTVRVAFPVVDTLVREVDALADSLPKLTAAVQTERTAHEALAVSISLITTAKSDTIRTLRRRPTRKLTALLMLTTGLAAYLAGAR